MPIKDPEQKRQYQREWLAHRRMEWFLGKSCVVCGSSKELQLDHKEPGQKVSHRIWSWAKERREKELAKCQVLCRTHHQAKTRLDNKYGQVHGTATSYQYYGCRCNPCKTIAVNMVNEWRWRTGRRKQRSGVAKW